MHCEDYWLLNEFSEYSTGTLLLTVATFSPDSKPTFSRNPFYHRPILWTRIAPQFFCFSSFVILLVSLLRGRLNRFLSQFLPHVVYSGFDFIFWFIPVFCITVISSMPLVEHCCHHKVPRVSTILWCAVCGDHAVCRPMLAGLGPFSTVISEIMNCNLKWM